MGFKNYFIEECFRVKNGPTKSGVLALFLTVLVIFSACGSDDTPKKFDYSTLPNQLVETTAAQIKSESELQSSVSHFDYDVSVHRITYPVQHRGGTITASGVIAIPKDLKGASILLDNHGTLQRSTFAPSLAGQGDFVYSFMEFASAGYIVFAPDYIGFGESVQEFHPWLLAEPGIEAIVEIIQSGREWLDENEVDYNDRIFMTGFSQGANMGLAAQRSIEQNQPQINLVASSLNSGAYDMDYTFTRRILGTTAAEALAGAYIIVALSEFYDWKEPMSTYFKEPYAVEIQNMLDASVPFIDSFFSTNQLSTDFANGTLSHENLYQESFLTDFRDNPSNPVKLRLIENNVHIWGPTTPMILYYGKDDSSTYFQNSINAHEKLIELGADPSNVRIVGFEGRDHEGTLDPWLKATLDWFDELR